MVIFLTYTSKLSTLIKLGSSCTLCYLLPGNKNSIKSSHFNIMRAVLLSCAGRVHFLFISVNLSSLQVAHLSDAPRSRLVVTRDSARLQDKTTASSAWIFNVLAVKVRHKGPRFKVSSERQLVIVRLTSPGIEPTTSSLQVERSIQLSHAGWFVMLFEDSTCLILRSTLPYF